jgi:branched-chain amino acid transport system ATP-binding protein
MPISLKLENVEVHYGKARAISDISLQVETGSITGIIGANGAGKSTIMRVLSGLKRLTNGRIWYHSDRIDTLASYEIVRSGIVLIPEGRRIFPYMTVLQNITIGAYLRKDKENIKKDIAKIFDRFPHLRKRHHQHAGTLSGGEQQMLAIARALMARPKVLLMDEPSWGLAPLIIEGLAETIAEINREGITILIVEQNAGLALELTDYIYVLEVGRVVNEGPKDKMIADETVRSAFLG